MIATFPNVEVKNLSEITFIGGTHKVLLFSLYTPENVLMEKVNVTPMWLLYPFHRDGSPVLSKIGTYNEKGYLIILNGSDTENLSGKYFQTFSLTGLQGYEQILGRGIINIIPRIGIKGMVV